MLDAEATSFLMMGSLSPGMKKHSVTLFEGGAHLHCLHSRPAASWLPASARHSSYHDTRAFPGTLNRR